MELRLPKQAWLQNLRRLAQLPALVTEPAVVHPVPFVGIGSCSSL